MVHLVVRVPTAFPRFSGMYSFMPILLCVCGSFESRSHRQAILDNWYASACLNRVDKPRLLNRLAFRPGQIVSGFRSCLRSTTVLVSAYNHIIFCFQ